MPHGWTRVNTPEELEKRLDDPRAFAEKATELVEQAGAVIGHIFWEQPGGPAYILTHVPGRNAEEIFERLDDAIGRTDRYYDGEELCLIQREGYESA
jgi:hypothetical protein